MKTEELKNGRTSADYSRIEQLGLTMAEQARRSRESAMLDFAMLEKNWRSFELDCRARSYDVFQAWERCGLLGQQLRCQLHWLSALELNATGDAFVEVATRDAAELREKNASYGESWKRRGGAGAFMMLARKWDRIDNILSPVGGGGTLESALKRNPGDVLDDIGDLRRYLLLVEDEALRLQDLPHYGHAPEGVIFLSPAECSSGQDRVKWAEGLIRQLPVEHDGRNSWLLNYGRSDEALVLQAKRKAVWDEEHNCLASAGSSGG